MNEPLLSLSNVNTNTLPCNATTCRFCVSSQSNRRDCEEYGTWNRCKEVWRLSSYLNQDVGGMNLEGLYQSLATVVAEDREYIDTLIKITMTKQNNGFSTVRQKQSAIIATETRALEKAIRVAAKYDNGIMNILLVHPALSQLRETSNVEANVIFKSMKIAFRHGHVTTVRSLSQYAADRFDSHTNNLMRSFMKRKRKDVFHFVDRNVTNLNTI